MKISKYSASLFTGCVTGDENPPRRSGRDLITLFNEFGFEDYYDFGAGGLPKLDNSETNTSRSDYAIDRMAKMDTNQTRAFLEEVLNRSENQENAIAIFKKAFERGGLAATRNGNRIEINGGVINNMPAIATAAHFHSIEQQILDALDSAKVMIWVAMAWFTNDNIQRRLLERLNSGIEVRLVIYRDGVNQAHGVDLTSFDVKEIRGTRGGIMHNKFCIIDNQTIITGSYNWSTNAETRNDENVTVIKDPERASDYSVEFLRLYRR